MANTALSGNESASEHILGAPALNVALIGACKPFGFFLVFGVDVRRWRHVNLKQEPGCDETRARKD
jgi:hypothetical protein